MSHDSVHVDRVAAVVAAVDLRMVRIWRQTQLESFLLNSVDILSNYLHVLYVIRRQKAYVSLLILFVETLPGSSNKNLHAYVIYHSVALLRHVT